MTFREFLAYQGRKKATKTTWFSSGATIISKLNIAN